MSAVDTGARQRRAAPTARGSYATWRGGRDPSPAEPIDREESGSGELTRGGVCRRADYSVPAKPLLQRLDGRQVDPEDGLATVIFGTDEVVMFHAKPE